MTDDTDDLFEALDRLANGRVLISASETAAVLNKTKSTLDTWIAKGHFPKWVQLTPRGPQEQFVKTIRTFLAKRRVARYQPPTPRGALRRGDKLVDRRRSKGGG
jgi:hypothetical protein